MKIVVLDGLTLNPGDLSWDGLHQLDDVEIHDRSSGEQIIERSKEAEILFTNKTPLGEEEFSQLPDLKYIGVLATGYNIVDIKAAKKRNITVTNIPAYSTNSVAQMTFALILELCLHVQDHSNAVHRGEWANSPDFSFWNSPLIELAGKTLGIIGFGSIGQQVSKVAEAFGMKVVASKSSSNNSVDNENIKRVDLDELFRVSDIISLHCPLFPSTKGIINKSNIEKMKRTAFLINTARGPLVIEEDLAEALNNDRIAGAGIDVLSTEPPKADNSLLTAKNCLVTPHISWATLEARTRLMNMAVDNLKAFLQGESINVVNK